MASNKENKENVGDKNLDFNKLTVVQLKDYLRNLMVSEKIFENLPFLSPW